MPPKSRTCYICGRQYMLGSFPIHVKQCQELFEQIEAQKPPKERRKCPTDPMLGMSHGTRTLDEMNAASFDSWTKEALVPCENCGRRFLPEKLIIHLRSCTEKNPARRVGQPVAVGKSVGFDVPEMESGPVLGMKNCPKCGRHFNEVSFARHVAICEKVFLKKRKPFDSRKARMKGTELEVFSNKRGGKMSGGYEIGFQGSRRIGRSLPTSANFDSVPKWKAESMSFRRAMREARLVSRAQAESKRTGIPLTVLLPPPSARPNALPSKDPRSSAPGYVQCPHCLRSFSQTSGERHIPQCKNMIHKPSRLLGHSGHAACSDSKSGGLEHSTWAGFSGRENPTFEQPSSSKLSNEMNLFARSAPAPAPTDYSFESSRLGASASQRPFRSNFGESPTVAARRRTEGSTKRHGSSPEKDWDSSTDITYHDEDVGVSEPKVDNSLRSENSFDATGTSRSRRRYKNPVESSTRQFWENSDSTTNSAGETFPKKAVGKTEKVQFQEMNRNEDMYVTESQQIGRGVRPTSFGP